MAVRDEQAILCEKIEELKKNLEEINFNNISEIKTIEAYIHKIHLIGLDVHEFQERRGEQVWKAFGPKLWTPLEKILYKLKQRRIDVNDINIQKEIVCQRKMTILTVFLAFISSLAAAVSSVCAIFSILDKT